MCGDSRHGLGDGREVELVKPVRARGRWGLCDLIGVKMSCDTFEGTEAAQEKGMMRDYTLV